MDALPVPRGWVPDAWFKAYNAADSQIYNSVGRDCRISKRKRESGETRERALGLWERYPMNKVMWAEREREDRDAEVAEVAVMEEEDQSGDESEDGEDGDEEEEEEESGDEEDVDERGTEIVWEQEVEESEEGEDEGIVDEMDVDGDSGEDAYDMSYLFEDF